MAIRQSDVELVRQQSDLVAIVGEHCAMKRTGRQWMAICPFHAESTASMSVNGEKGYFHCFGCQKKGDVITFVREIEHLSFVEAVEVLARRSNIEIHHDGTNDGGAERKRKAALGEVMTAAVEWYHQRLLKSPDAGAARAYLRERGYNRGIVEQFQIGWAPDSWDEFGRALKLSSQDLKDTGLGFINRRGRIQDAFRARVMFPIFDASGQPVAFGGRILPGSNDPAKYKNSQETLLYKKSRTLYGLNWSKNAVVNSNELIVCEGYTDVIAFFQAGAPYAVATCGTAITEGHIRQMLNFAKRIVLAYDADRAGQEAASRVYEWEKKFGIDVAVAALPKGKDPADLGRANPTALVQSVKEARPFLAFRLERVFSSGDMRSVEGRTRLARTAVQIVSEQSDSLIRDQYLLQVSDRTRVSVDDLHKLMSGRDIEVQNTRASRVVDVRSASTKQGDPPEVEQAALALAIHHTDEVGEFLDQITAIDAPDAVEEVLFEDVVAQQGFAALRNTATFLDALDAAGPDASDLLGRLATREYEGDAAEEYMRLIDRAAQRVMRELAFSIRSQPGDFAEIGPLLAWLKLTVEQLRDSETRFDAATALMKWMLEDLAEQHNVERTE